MSINDAEITRIYRCSREDCDCKISYTEKVSRPWRKICPLCHKKSLYLDSASSSLSLLFDVKNGHTLGSLSDANNRRREKESGPKKSKGKKPFWRSKDRVDYKVLKNPAKYIQTGSI